MKEKESGGFVKAGFHSDGIPLVPVFKDGPALLRWLTIQRAPASPLGTTARWLPRWELEVGREQRCLVQPP